MSNDNIKIGKLISETRIERGLTQADLAKKLKTSQSAVNRIEKGKQNLSIDTIAKLSKALDREIVSISSGDRMSFKVNGGTKLKGSIETKVSKNASMGLLFASLLNKNVTILERVPHIEEVSRVIEVFSSIGVETKWINKNRDLEIRPPKSIDIANMDKKAARRTRSVIMAMAPLMNSKKEFDIPFAGGCKLGERTVRPHLFALEEFGLKVKTTAGNYKCTVSRKKPGEVILYESGDTVTENALMAAASTPGKTVIKYATANYMVQDVCFYLQKLGIKIEGIGTTTLTVHGKQNINKRVRYSPSEDPIESMTFIAAAVATNSAITIKRCPIEFLELELLKMKKMGYKFKLSEVYKSNNGKTNLVDIKTSSYDNLTALEDKIHALPYPGINMDNVPYFALIASCAKGETLIHDWVYENRAIYYTELNKLGGNVKLADPHRAYIRGPVKFKPVDIMAPIALRPAMMLLLAMLAAPGTSILRDVYIIKRGYEDIAQRLNSLGADITVLRSV